MKLNKTIWLVTVCLFTISSFTESLYGKKVPALIAGGAAVASGVGAGVAHWYAKKKRRELARKIARREFRSQISLRKAEANQKTLDNLPKWLAGASILLGAGAGTLALMGGDVKGTRSPDQVAPAGEQKPGVPADISPSPLSPTTTPTSTPTSTPTTPSTSPDTPGETPVPTQPTGGGQVVTPEPTPDAQPSDGNLSDTISVIDQSDNEDYLGSMGEYESSAADYYRRIASEINTIIRNRNGAIQSGESDTSQHERRLKELFRRIQSGLYYDIKQGNINTHDQDLLWEDNGDIKPYYDQYITENQSTHESRLQARNEELREIYQSERELAQLLREHDKSAELERMREKYGDVYGLVAPHRRRTRALQEIIAWKEREERLSENSPIASWERILAEMDGIYSENNTLQQAFNALREEVEGRLALAQVRIAEKDNQLQEFLAQEEQVMSGPREAELLAQNIEKLEVLLEGDFSHEDIAGYQEEFRSRLEKYKDQKRRIDAYLRGNTPEKAQELYEADLTRRASGSDQANTETEEQKAQRLERERKAKEEEESARLAAAALRAAQQKEQEEQEKRERERKQQEDEERRKRAEDARRERERAEAEQRQREDALRDQNAIVAAQGGARGTALNDLEQLSIQSNSDDASILCAARTKLSEIDNLIGRRDQFQVQLTGSEEIGQKGVNDWIADDEARIAPPRGEYYQALQDKKAIALSLGVSQERLDQLTRLLSDTRILQKSDLEENEKRLYTQLYDYCVAWKNVEDIRKRIQKNREQRTALINGVQYISTMSDQQERREALLETINARLDAFDQQNRDKLSRYQIDILSSYQGALGQDKCAQLRDMRSEVEQLTFFQEEGRAEQIALCKLINETEKNGADLSNRELLGLYENALAQYESQERLNPEQLRLLGNIANQVSELHFNKEENTREQERVKSRIEYLQRNAVQASRVQSRPNSPETSEQTLGDAGDTSVNPLAALCKEREERRRRKNSSGGAAGAAAPVRATEAVEEEPVVNPLVALRRKRLEEMERRRRAAQEQTAREEPVATDNADSAVEEESDKDSSEAGAEQGSNPLRSLWASMGARRQRDGQ